MWRLLVEASGLRSCHDGLTEVKAGTGDEPEKGVAGFSKSEKEIF